MQRGRLVKPEAKSRSPDHDPGRILSAKVLLRAVKDSRSRDEKLSHEARAWLRGEDAAALMAALDIEPDAARLALEIEE